MTEETCTPMERDGSDDADRAGDEESLSPQLLSLIVSYAVDERRGPEDDIREHLPDRRTPRDVRSPKLS